VVAAGGVSFLSLCFLTVYLSTIQTGFSINLTQLDGKEFTVKIDDIIECDHVLRVPGKGMPRRNGRGYGDLYITFEVDFPDKLSQHQKDALKATFSQSNSGQDEL
jgi:DnaJ-class molecular chaperone